VVRLQVIVVMLALIRKRSHEDCCTLRSICRSVRHDEATNGLLEADDLTALVLQREEATVHTPRIHLTMKATMNWRRGSPFLHQAPYRARREAIDRMG
jgi:hypothetical protein